jgi:hypothetical protein
MQDVFSPTFTDPRTRTARKEARGHISKTNSSAVDIGDLDPVKALVNKLHQISRTRREFAKITVNFFVQPRTVIKADKAGLCVRVINATRRARPGTSRIT